MADREFDIIVYGATGYTGRLVAEHFLREYTSADDGPKWAMAGRSLSKLKKRFLAASTFRCSPRLER